MKLLASMIDKISKIGDLESDSPKIRTRKRFLIYTGLFMSCGGLLWGGISTFFGKYFAAIIPFSYTLLTVFNFTYFYITKNFRAVRFFQVLISFLLPFIFQWILGGFLASGVVMLWAMLAVVGSMTFNETKSNWVWLALFSVLTIFTGVIDGWVSKFVPSLPAGTARLLLVLNIVVISNIVFGLMIYLINTQEKTSLKLLHQEEQIKKSLAEKNNTLEVNINLRESIEKISRHDLKNPLQMIMGASQLLQEDKALNEKQLKLLQNQEKACYQMLNMINNSLDLVKMERKSFRKDFVKVDMAAISREILDKYPKIKNQITLNGSLASMETPFYIWGDPNHSFSMMANLIGNAIKASVPGQTVKIHFMDDEQPEIWIENEAAVPEHIRDTFFDKYSTSGKAQGTGLGTYSARLIAETHGASIDMKTSDEKGTRITIKYPTNANIHS